jgi:hypothetical protein
MANVEHSAIVTANCHEPKYITSSITSDAGKVITANSTTAGTSEFRKLTPFELDTALQHRFQSTLENNATVLAATGASIYTAGSYNDLILTTEDAGLAKVGFTFASASGELTVVQTGVYLVSISMSVSSSAITNVGLNMATDGTYLTGSIPPVTVSLQAIGDIHSLSTSFEVTMTAAEVLKLGLAASVTSNLTVHDAVWTVRRVE